MFQSSILVSVDDSCFRRRFLKFSAGHSMISTHVEPGMSRNKIRD